MEFVCLKIISLKFQDLSSLNFNSENHLKIHIILHCLIGLSKYAIHTGVNNGEKKEER